MQPPDDGETVKTWKEFDQNVITHSAAHHLMAIDDLIQRLGYARVSDIARQLNITRGSVSISLRPLKKSGLILQDENRHLRLSEQGQELVDAIKTKRQIVQRLFVELLGVNDQQAEIDACKLEHLVSNETARRLVSFLHFLDAHPKPAAEFVAAWQSVDPSCARQPRAGQSCDTECLAKNVPE
ncbi:MAG: metal-dependent transcriptional regulator [Planctomycetota bacterium]